MRVGKYFITVVMSFVLLFGSGFSHKVVSSAPVEADLWLLFEVDQDRIDVSTRKISGELLLGNSYETELSILVNDELVTKSVLKANEDSFSVDVDLSKFKAGDVLKIRREYTGEMLENLGIWPSEKTMKIKKTKNKICVVKKTPLFRRNSTKKKLVVKKKAKNNILIKNIKKGTVIKRIGRKGKFLRVQVAKKKGFILRKNVKRI